MGGGAPLLTRDSSGRESKERSPSQGIRGWILSRRARGGWGGPSIDFGLLIPSRAGFCGATAKSHEPSDR